MLVVCNGAIKSGSTWLYNILTGLLEVSRPPERFLTDRTRVNATISPERIREFLEQVDFVSESFITKNHLGKPEHKELLLSFPHVYVVDIVRDVRDVVVSAYYDAKNRDGIGMDFDSFYWGPGRELADSVTRYHQLWSPDGERILRVSYEALKKDFTAEIKKVGLFFGMELSEARCDELFEHTSMTTLKERYQAEELYRDSKFFRKGIVGDWQNHFSDAMTRDIAKVERDGLSRYDRRVLQRRISKRFNIF